MSSESTAQPDPQTELFVGLVGAVGTDLLATEDLLGKVLAYYGYRTRQLRLSSYLKELNWAGARDLPDSPFDAHVWEHMQAGTDLRNAWGRGDALALLALNEIATIRREVVEPAQNAAPAVTGESRNRAAEASVAKAAEPGSANASEGSGQQTDEEELPPALDRHAFVLRSLKHPDEVETLRSVLGPRFFLIAAYSPRKLRRRRLEDDIADGYGDPDPGHWQHSPDQLMERDEAEDDPLGQQLRDTFHRADAFVDASDTRKLRSDLERIVAILFGDPFKTPLPDEYALFAAEGAARRSAEPGRQVGAAIATTAGSVVALGTNEVPKALGGLYWEGDENDAREFHVAISRNTRRDTNDVHREEIAQGIIQALTSLGVIEIDGKTEKELRDVILGTDVGDLTEYGRAVHAEMAALLDAAARGVPVHGCVLYTTTFPCHNCARHIIAAGITKVVYVAPYAKSRAWELHAEDLEVAPETPAPNKVPLMPFVGVAARRYLELFDAGWRARSPEHLARKDAETGLIAQFRPREAVPVFADLEPAEMRPRRGVYRFREAQAVAFMHRLSEEKGLTLKKEEKNG